MTSPVALQYYAAAQKDFKPPLIANENAFLGDIYSSEKNDTISPLSAGFYRLEKGIYPVSPHSPNPGTISKEVQKKLI